MSKFVFFLILLSPPLLADPISKWPTLQEEPKDILGKSIKWTTGRNGALVIFTSEHCPYDNDWKSRILQVGQWASKNDFNVFFINPYNPKAFKLNNLKNMKASASNFGENLPYIPDHQQLLAKQFRVQRTPTTIVFNADKSRVYFGMVDDQPDPKGPISEKYLEQALKKLAVGDNNPITSTQPLGCLIGKEQP